MNLWLVPVDEPSYRATLVEPVDLTDGEERPDDFPEPARVWGIRTDPEQGTWERNRRNRDPIDRGDPLLVYRNSASRYTATGRVGPMGRTEYIRDTYWNGGPALDVFVVKDYDGSIDIEPEAVNDLLGYEEAFWPQGLWRVSGDRPTAEVVRRFGIQDRFPAVCGLAGALLSVPILPSSVSERLLATDDPGPLHDTDAECSGGRDSPLPIVGCPDSPLRRGGTAR